MIVLVKSSSDLIYYDKSATVTFAKYEDGFWCIFSPFADLGSAPFAVREDRLQDFVSPDSINQLQKELNEYKADSN